MHEEDRRPAHGLGGTPLGRRVPQPRCLTPPMCDPPHTARLRGAAHGAPGRERGGWERLTVPARCAQRAEIGDGEGDDVIGGDPDHERVVGARAGEDVHLIDERQQRTDDHSDRRALAEYPWAPCAPDELAHVGQRSLGFHVPGPQRRLAPLHSPAWWGATRDLPHIAGLDRIRRIRDLSQTDLTRMIEDAALLATATATTRRDADRTTLVGESACAAAGSYGARFYAHM